MLASVMLEHDVAYAVPRVQPAEDIVARAPAIAEKTGATVAATNDPVEAVSGSHVIYDVFVSMGEEHLDGKMNDFDGFQVNEDLVANADQTRASCAQHPPPRRGSDGRRDGPRTVHCVRSGDHRVDDHHHGTCRWTGDLGPWAFMGLGLIISTLTRKPNNPASMPRRKRPTTSTSCPCRAVRWW